ncbi:MAG: alpha-2-macroglobulin family protein [Xanthomonadales bacterium]|nr:alpha-2-macroglobulin family protein [Xanthomonadales bacterium]
MRLAHLAWTALLLLLLTACGGGAGDRGEDALPAAEAATRWQAPEDSSGFHIARIEGYTRWGRPSLRLVAAEPLAPAQDFDSLLDLTDGDGARPNGSWQLESDNRTLSFPWLEADRRYRLRVDAALAAASGASLPEPLAVEVYSGPQTPLLGFASQGHVLPGRDSAGLPVVTVNVAEADVEFLRVRESSLPAFLSSWHRNGQRGSWELEQIAELADSVWASRFALRAEANRRTLNHIPVDHANLAEPGAYFAVMRPAGRFQDTYATALFFVSDIGVHARQHSDGLFVHVASLATGRPLAGVELRLLDAGGTAVATVQSDRSGTANLPVRPAREHVLLARRGGDLSLLPFGQPALDLAAFDLPAGSASAPASVFLWAGRDLFRPGETLRVHALARDADGRAMAPAPLFLRLRQPDGRTFLEQSVMPDALGYTSLVRELPPEAATGRWRLEAARTPDGDAIGAMPLRVEEFLPERLKLDLATPESGSGPTLALSADSAWLYGAPAAGLRFLAELSFEHAPAGLPGLPGFHFGDPGLALPGPGDAAFDGPLDAAGRAELSLALPETLPVQTPVAVFARGSVFEPGGRAVSRTVRQLRWPAQPLPGIRPLFDIDEGAPARATVAFEVAMADADGRLSDGRVQVQVLRDDREVVWTHDLALGWRAEYTSNWRPVGPARTVTLSAQAPVRIESEVDWGDYRLELTPDGASAPATRLSFHAGWRADDDNRGEAARPDRIRMALDRTGYRAGDDLVLTLTPPHPGPGLLLVEAGGTLLHSQPIEATAGGQVRLTVAPAWERHDVYLTALVFRPGSAREKITPNRALGVVHLPIAREDRRVEVAASAPERARPGDTVPVRVSAPALAGSTARATVSLVDQGIINITRYGVPDAGAQFFAPRRYAVDAYDLYGRVIEHLDGHQARQRYGGDLALAVLAQARRPTAKVATVDLFDGPVELDAQGNAEVGIELPDFNGRLRLAVLVYDDHRHGHAEGAIEVRAPLVAEVSSPRVMAPGDSAVLSVDLHNLSGQRQSLALTVRAEPPLALAEGNQRLVLEDGARRTLSLPLRALSGEGVGRIALAVRGEGIALDRNFELVVRPGWAPLRDGSLERLAPGSHVRLDRSALAGLFDGSGRIGLAVSSRPPVPFASAVDGLLGYPYGCLEQTVSRAFPLALLDAQTAQRMALPALAPDARRRALDDAFARVGAMQLGNGHFGLWAGEGQAQTQLTPFVAEFLLEAREAGEAIPEPVLERALTRLTEDLLAGGERYYAYQNGPALRFAVRAHAGYVLARLGRAPLGTLRAMLDHEREQAASLMSLVHLGLALHLQGDQRRGLGTVQAALAGPPRRPAWLGDYGSELRDRALALALIARHGLAVEGAEGELLALARELAARDGRQGGMALTTQEQLALFRLGRQMLAAEAAPMRARAMRGDEAVAVSGGGLWTALYDEGDLAAGVELHNEGDTPLWLLRERVGTPLSPPAADAAGIAVRRDWFTPDGRPFRGDALREGDSLVVRLTVEAREQVEDLVVVDPLPGGLEVENLNLLDARLLQSLVIEGEALGQRGGSELIRNEEYRDDRYSAVLRLWSGQTGQLWYVVRAVSPGEYAVPPVQAEDMYRPWLRAVGAARARLRVLPPQGLRQAEP